MQSTITMYLDGKPVSVDMTRAKLDDKIRKGAYITVLIKNVYHTVKADRLTATPEKDCGGFWRN